MLFVKKAGCASLLLWWSNRANLRGKGLALKRKREVLRLFFQKDIETMNRRDLEALQLERLKHIVDYCYNNVPFYHERLRQAGVTGDKIKTLSRRPIYPLYHEG